MLFHKKYFITPHGSYSEKYSLKNYRDAFTQLLTHFSIWNLKRLLVTFSVLHADGALVFSDAEKNLLAKIGFPIERISILPNPVYDFRPHLHQTSTKPSAKNILFVGNCSIEKGFPILLKAFKNLIVTHSNVKLKILTRRLSQDLSQKLKNDEHLNGKIEVIENPTPELIAQAYAECEFLVLPATWQEAFGLPAFEAMYFKKPVVVTSNFLSLQWLSSTGVICIPPNDVLALKKAMSHLLTDDTYREQCGMANFNHISQEHFSIKEISLKYKEIYSQWNR